MRKNKIKCPLCNSKKPSRKCISLNKEICSGCCGERRNEGECKDCDYLSNIEFNKLREEEVKLRKKVEKINSFTDKILSLPIGKKLLEKMAQINPKARNEEVTKMARECPREIEMFFRVTAEKDPTVHNIFSYGNILSDINQPRKAIEQFKKAISLDKNNLYIYLALAAEYEKIKELELSENAYKNALDLDKSQKLVQWKYFNILAEQKKFDIIKEEARKMLKDNPDNLVVAFHLLESTVLQNDAVNLRLAYLNFLSAKVGDPKEKEWFNPILDKIIEMKKKLGSDILISDEEKFPSKEELQEYFRKEGIDKTFDEYNEVFSIFPNINRINFSLGILHELKLDFNKAVFYYKRALELTRNLETRLPICKFEASIETIKKALSDTENENKKT